MRVHLVSAVFPPEPLTSARTTHDIAAELSRRGHETTVFAPYPNRPSAELPPGWRRSLRRSLRPTIRECDGVRVVHTWHSLSRRSSLGSRAAENLSFGLTSSARLLREPAPHVAYLNTWPLLAQLANARILGGRGVPTICAVHDLYPESLPWADRLLSGHPLMRSLRALDASVYRNCRLVTALNAHQAEALAETRGVPRSGLVVVPDWVDASRFPRGLPRANRFRRALGAPPGGFLAIYAGSLTRSAGLGVTVEAAEHLRRRPEVRIAVVGRGPEAKALGAAVRERRLPNLVLVDELAPEDVPEVQAAADALLFGLEPGAAELTTPSKLVHYLFSERPIVASVSRDGPAGRIVAEADCGRVILPGDGKALADALVQMAQAPHSARRRLGANARRHADEHFRKDRVLPRLCDLIERVGEGGPRVGSDGA
jgi:glycosyltransferase involved in cell wall biosynthesis